MFGHIDYSRHADRDLNESETSSSDEQESDSTQDGTNTKRNKHHHKHKRIKHPRALRMYTIKTVEQCELVTLSFLDLENLRVEFPEVYQDLFQHQKYKLQTLQKVKNHAIKLLDIRQSSKNSRKKSSSGA